jgi:glucokinase
MNPRQIPHALGIDVGGTNLKALAVSHDGLDLQEWQAPTGDDGTLSWQGNVRQLLADICGQLGPPSAVGIAAPGLPESDRPVIRSMPGRLHGIEGLDWRGFLSAGTPVTLINDARAALLGEVWRGAAKNCRNVVLVTLGTGVGGAVMVDGRVLGGHLCRAGHLGHMSLDPFGKPDCVATPGSLEDAMGDFSLVERSAGRCRSTADMLPWVLNGETEACQIWDRSIQCLAAALTSFINLFDPEVIVVGGGISKAGSALFDPLQKAMDRCEWRLANCPAVRIVPAELSSHAGAVGAARAALDLLPIPKLS